jgi:hypothetical protein
VNKNEFVGTSEDKVQTRTCRRGDGDEDGDFGKK